MVKLIIKNILFGIAFGCVAIVFLAVFGGLSLVETLFGGFNAGAFWSIAISTAFAVSAVVYECERIAFWLKVAINASSGLVALTASAFGTGWITAVPPLAAVLVFVLNLCVFAVIWVCDYLLSRKEAENINERLGKWE